MEGPMITVARPGARLVLEAAAGTVGFGVVAVALVTGISAADRGFDDALMAVEVLHLVGPLGAAVAVAVAVARSRGTGRWDGWSMLGTSPRQQLAPLVLIAVLGGAAQHVLPPTARISTTLSAIAAPAPIDAHAHWWPDGEGGWDAPDLTDWQTRPGTLTTSELRARVRIGPPRGARRGVDRGELVRRRGLVLAWPVAVLWGMGAGLVASPRRRGPGATVPRAGALAAAGSAVWLVLVLSAAAYASVGM
jgi:hypothetical protein